MSVYTLLFLLHSDKHITQDAFQSTLRSGVMWITKKSSCSNMGQWDVIYYVCHWEKTQLILSKSVSKDSYTKSTNYFNHLDVSITLSDSIYSKLKRVCKIWENKLKDVNFFEHDSSHQEYLNCISLIVHEINLLWINCHIFHPPLISTSWQTL